MCIEDIMCKCGIFLAASKDVYFRRAAVGVGYHLVSTAQSTQRIVDRLKKRDHIVVAKRALFPFQILCQCGKDVACMRPESGDMVIFFDAMATYIQRCGKAFSYWRIVQGKCFYIKTLQEKKDAGVPHIGDTKKLQPGEKVWKAGQQGLIENVPNDEPPHYKNGGTTHARRPPYISTDLLHPKTPSAPQGPPKTTKKEKHDYRTITLEFDVRHAFAMGIISTLFVLLVLFWATN
jgi:hypothetical protein